MILHRALLLIITITVIQAAGAASFGERIQQFFGSSDLHAEREVFLKPDEAFVMTARVTGPETINIYWQIADGHYLYRDKFAFEIVEGAVEIDQSAVVLPPSKVKQDPSFGSVEVNYREVNVDLPVIRQGRNKTSFVMEVKYQGCKEDSICYPPIAKQVSLVLDPLLIPAAANPAGVEETPQRLSRQDAIKETLITRGVWLNVLAFFGFGLLLSLTPCVFPMIPILSGIIVGQGNKITPRAGFLLSLSYVTAMALTYALAGIVAATLHFNLQVASQEPWVISIFSLIFVALALSMFGFYEIQLPVAWQTKLFQASSNRNGGSFTGAFLMGALSAIIVGPCVAPPLAGALLYISQTGNQLLGGVALFALGLGMGIPLLVIGASAGGILPRAGRWMDAIKKVFGVLLIAVAIWFIGRIVPPSVELFLWAALLIITSIYMGVFGQVSGNTAWPRLRKGTGIIMLVYGVTLLIGAAGGSESLFKPLHGIVRINGQDGALNNVDKPEFKKIKSLADLQLELEKAGLENKIVLLDFYADWCVTCIEMEKYTFPAPSVRSALNDTVLLQADVTKHDAIDQALMKEFNIFGPPAILFFGKGARECKAHRLVGFVPAEEFAAHVEDALRC